MTPIAHAALVTARGELGVCEVPLGSNSGPRVKVYQDFAGGVQAEGQPWCVAFALWCIAHAAHTLGQESALPRTASSSALYAWLKAHGKLLDQPQSGCIGIIRGGPTGHEHTFLVDVVDPNRGVVWGIDGNWGNRVAVTQHHLADCDFGEIC